MPSAATVDLPVFNVPVFQLGNEQAWSDEEVICLAVRYLAGRCDGARTADGTGFNRWDAKLGHELADRPWVDWSDHDLWLAYKVLRRYANTQLKSLWYAIPRVERPISQWQREKDADYAAFKQRADPTWRAQPDHRVLALATDDEGRPAVEIRFKYDEALLAVVRQLPQRRWLKEQRRWVVPMHLDALEPLLDFAIHNGFDVDPGVATAIDQEVQRLSEAVALSHAAFDELLVPGLRPGLELRPFQAAGVRYAMQTGSVLFADQMGLGKTIEAIATAAALNAFPLLVVCPASIKGNWRRELKRWLPALDREDGVAVLSGSPSDSFHSRARRLVQIRSDLEHGHSGVTFDGRAEAWPSQFGQATLSLDGPLGLRAALEAEEARIKRAIGDSWAVLSPRVGAVVVNYDVLGRWLPVLRTMPFKAVVFDEAHKLKSSSAQRTRHSRELTDSLQGRVMLLTGTPVMNRPSELWTLIDLLGHGDKFGGYRGFHKRYCEDTSVGDLHELSQRLRSVCMIRRTKAQVLKELPPKQMVIVPVELDNRPEYDAAEQDLAHWYASTKAEDERLVEDLRAEAAFSGMTETETLDWIGRRTKEVYDAKHRMVRENEQLMRWEILKQCCLRGKLSAIYQWIDTFLESGEKLVVFATHTAAVEGIAARYGWEFITGSVDPKDRLPIVDRFQSPEGPQGIVGNILAMGEGLTLTAASDSCTVELGWNPSQHEQSEDRLHRIGQTDSVTNWYLVAEGTIEDEIAGIIKSKKELVDAVHEGAGEQQQQSLIQELKERMRSKLEGVGS